MSALAGTIPRIIRIGLTAQQHEALCAAWTRSVIEARVRTRLDSIWHHSGAEDLAQEAQAILDYGHVAEMDSVQHPSAARLAQRPLHGSLALVAWALR